MYTMENIINKLGYSDSQNLYRRSDFSEELNKTSDITHQTLRLLRELNPYACYCVDNKPFVLFFEQVNDSNTKKIKHQKVWNSQTAVAIFDCESHIEIYNGYSLDEKNKELSLVDEIDMIEMDPLSAFSYWNITNINFWEKFQGDFSNPTLDEILLENISYIIKYLQQRECESFAVKLTLRLIFIRFLIDRGVDLNYKDLSNDSLKTKEQFLSIVKNKSELYDLFDHLKGKFNGNLFDYHDNSKQNEMELLDDNSLVEIYHFLSGKIDLPSNQLTLFPLYDFNIIPVELISNIYERLLGIGRQKKDGAFYTPTHLVNFILEQKVKPHLTHEQVFTVLDPSCGSGIFLVESLRYLIEANLGGNDYFQDDKALVSLATNHIYGVDKNPEAIDVAIFSLYLTLLDYKDPKSLKSFKLPILKGKNLLVDDFFSTEIDKKLESIAFDFIIGNPPWGKVKDKLHLDYCRKHNIPIQNNEISRSFIARTKDFSTDKTRCCLIVTSKLFYNSQNKAKDFREWLLTNASIGRFIEMSPVRDLIFKNALGPAAVVFYSFKDHEINVKENFIEYITLKPNLLFKLFNIIVIEASDKKEIPQQLLFQDDWAWKTFSFGTINDYYTIKSLKKGYETMEDIAKTSKMSGGTGYQVSGGDKNDASFLIGNKVLHAQTGLSPFKIDLSQSEEFKLKTVHRTRKSRKEIFDPPYVLFKKGIDTKSYRLRAAYSEEKMVFTDSTYSIAGDVKDKDALLSFTGLLNSSFYAYLNLLLGTTAGIEREQAFPTVALTYPALVSEILAEKVAHIQDVAEDEDNGIFQNNLEDEDFAELIKEMDHYILSCFALQNNKFVEYALDIQIPLLTGDTDIHRNVRIQDLEYYIDPFIDYWDDVLQKDDLFIQVVFYPSIANRFAAVEVKFVKNKPAKEILFIEGQNEQMALVSRFMLNKQNDLFYHMKDIINFEENSFYILKSNEYKNWHPAIGEVDLAKVIDAILGESRNSHEWV